MVGLLRWGLRVFTLWLSVGKDGCIECLEKAEKEVKGCLPSKEGRGMNAGFYLRYSTDKFFNHEEDTHGGMMGKRDD
ncbi:hypothetical protein GH714_010222 [Hevea brasiliensis]|uniref:Uncharacterized protein n=1 Tax=Hevea brasiliensis TaxID=3981 RepID=A0A6A6M8C2_HEVBR|nr:hypothetical protein GH714_010222 [Hevea brasiliensis]